MTMPSKSRKSKSRKSKSRKSFKVVQKWVMNDCHSASCRLVIDAVGNDSDAYKRELLAHLTEREGVTGARRLAQGFPMGQGPIAGKRFAHSWIEIGDWVFDTNRPHALHWKADYYRAGQIDPAYVRTYSAHEAAAEMVRQGYFTIWHDVPEEYRDVYAG